MPKWKILSLVLLTVALLLFFLFMRENNRLGDFFVCESDGNEIVISLLLTDSGRKEPLGKVKMPQTPTKGLWVSSKMSPAEYPKDIKFVSVDRTLAPGYWIIEINGQKIYINRLGINEKLK